MDSPWRLPLEEIAISKFKATCLAVLEKVRKTGQPIRVTRFGQAIAEINPPPSARTVRRFGHRTGSGRILGDIVSPIGDELDWEAAAEPEQNEDKRRK